MGAVRSKVRVTAPVQGAADVTVYRANGSTEALSYTTETGSSAHTFPVTVAAGASTDFWMQNGDYVVSTVIDTVEMAGGYGQTRALRVEADGWILRPDAPGGGGGGGGGDLDDLGDVDMTGKVVGSVPSWDGAEYVPASPAVLSDDTPLAAAETAAPGTSEEAARSDHAHPVTTYVNNRYIYRVGSYYRAADGAASAGNFTDKNIMILTPFPGTVRGLTIDRVSVSVLVTGSGSDVLRWVVYDHDAATGEPSSLIAEGTIDVVASTGVKTETVSVVIPAGRPWFWVGGILQAPGGSPAVARLFASEDSGAAGTTDTGNMFSGTRWSLGRYHNGSVTGAAPASYSFSATAQSNCPLVAIRIGALSD